LNATRDNSSECPYLNSRLQANLVHPCRKQNKTKQNKKKQRKKILDKKGFLASSSFLFSCVYFQHFLIYFFIPYPSKNREPVVSKHLDHFYDELSRGIYTYIFVTLERNLNKKMPHKLTQPVTPV